MEHWEREHLVSQISSGVLFLQVKDKTYIYKNPSKEHRYFANQIYKKVFHSSKKDGIYDETDLLSFLLSQGFWTVEEDEKLEKMSKDVSDLKVKLFELELRSV